jgi:hypothetical protein
LLVDGAAWSSQLIATAVNLDFLDWNRCLFFQMPPYYTDKTERTMFQTHYFSENLVAPEIELRTAGPVAKNPNNWTTE